jgi:hypothetical protein
MLFHYTNIQVYICLSILNEKTHFFSHVMEKYIEFFSFWSSHWTSSNLAISINQYLFMSHEKIAFASSSHGKMYKNLSLAILFYHIHYWLLYWFFHIPNLNTWANDKLEPINFFHCLKIFNENLYLLKHWGWSHLG